MNLDPQARTLLQLEPQARPFLELTLPRSRQPFAPELLRLLRLTLQVLPSS